MTEDKVINVKLEQLEKKNKEQDDYMRSNFDTIYERIEDMRKDTNTIIEKLFSKIEDVNGNILKFFFGLLGAISISAIMYIITTLSNK